MWLESGSLIFGPLDAEAAMALPNPDFHALQDKFLKIHDKKTKRLWFLWPVNDLKILPTVVGKCGCHGGCAFFGNNRNGVGFFSQRKSKEAASKAVLQISPQGQDPGFGQSLLVTDKLVFDVLPNNGELSPAKNFTFTRGYMSDMLTPESPGTNITVIEDPSLSHESSTQTVSKVEQDHSQTGVSTDQVDTSPVRAEFSDKTVSPGSESLPQDSLTSPVSETHSLVSRLSSMEEGLAKQMPSISSSPLMEGRRKVSIDLGNAGLSRVSKSNASLQSAKSLRQEKTFSAVSLESERYYSAEEDNVEITTVMSDGSLDYSMLSTGTQDQTLRSTEVDNLNETVIQRSRKRPRQERMGSASSGSTSSFESAATEQSDSGEDSDELDSPELLENFSMVDLHSQVNKPITQSPILMNCYSGHLTQYECRDWSSPQPIQGSGELKHDQSACSLSSACQSLQYIHSPAFLPHFKRTRQGFSPALMASREKLAPGDPRTPGYGKAAQGEGINIKHGKEEQIYF